MNIVDLLAKEYGWTIQDIQNLTFKQFLKIQEAIGMRYKAQAEAMDEAANGKKKVRKIDPRTLPSGKKIAFNKI